MEVSSGDRLSVWLPAGVGSGQAVRLAIRPENVRFGAFANGEPNRFTARVLAQHYQGAQTIDQLAVLGGRIEAMQLGTSLQRRRWHGSRNCAPPDVCWGYPSDDRTAAT